MPVDAARCEPGLFTLDTNPKRQRGPHTHSLADASGWYGEVELETGVERGSGGSAGWGGHDARLRSANADRSIIVAA